MNKKAQGIQFNWIFILIAGVIILALFITFALDYKNLSFKKANTQLTIELDSQLDLLSIEKLATKIDPAGIGQFKVDFFCDDFSINKANKIDIKDKIIFAPSSVESSTLLLWTDELYLPYKVVDLIYISSPDIKYYFYPAGKVKELLEYLPKKFDTDEQFFNVEAVSSFNENKIKQDIYGERLKEIKFILFEDAEIPRFDIKNTKINVYTTEDLDFGLVNSEYYIEKQLLLGAIFSDNYDCFLNKIADKISLLNQVYKEKAIRLHTKSLDPTCTYSVIISDLGKPVYIEELYETQEKISQKNKNLFMKGCLDVY